MNRAIVIGGAGFIGSHIVEELLKYGFHVAILDNLSAGKLNNIDHLIEKNNIQFIQGSISDFSLLQSLFSNIDYVFHQASIPNEYDNNDYYLPYYEANSNGTLNVLQAAKENNIKKVIFASSCAVYGNEPTQPKSEDMAPLPESPYAITKLVAEYYCAIYNRVHNLPTVCLRYFNVYGPRQNPNSPLASVIPKFIQKGLEGKPPIIYGDGEQTRDFVYVRDVASANILAAKSNALGIYNIGTGRRVSLNQVTQIILQAINRSDIRIIYEKERPSEIRHSVADISKAKTFGYIPQYTLESGLREMIGMKS
jgi:nucleoside-diphosphate-sugar epimerase